MKDRASPRFSATKPRTDFAKRERMTVWQKPSFEELAMNAEIGAYQPENPEDDRGEEPFVQTAAEDPANWAIPVHCG